MKRFLVTGATSGVGREVSRALQAEGHEVIICGRDVGRLTDEETSPGVSEAFFMDFAAVEPIEISERLKALGGPVDGIFHGAGAELVLPLRLTSDALYRRAMSYADSTFAILRAAASKGVMRDTAGSIVIMSSVAAARGTAGMGAYSAARAAVEGLVRVAAVELSARAIRVNALAAGAFLSPMHTRLMAKAPESSIVEYAGKHPLGFGTLHEIRDAALYLLSDASRWQTGSVMTVDGGYMAS